MGDPNDPTMTERRPSLLVIDTIAEAVESDPLTVVPPLGDVIDPDALDAIFAQTDGQFDAPIELRFSYQDYAVRVARENATTIDVEVSPMTQRK